MFPNIKGNLVKFPSPHSGILFLFTLEKGVTLSVTLSFRPLIRGFFFYNQFPLTIHINCVCFRPLIRGFFFYAEYVKQYADGVFKFPSPHSGILFLWIVVITTKEELLNMFPSPHSGILFLCNGGNPSIAVEYPRFPSPHSGILFLFH